jgi:hypothetical protein
MVRWRRAMLGLLGGIGVCALLALGAFGWGYHPASAAGPTGAQANATPSAADEQQLFNMLYARFAARLGTDEATVDAAFLGAVEDTLNQAVHDGKMTADEASKIKADAARIGLKGLIAGEQNKDNSSGNRETQKADAAMMAAWNTAATMLGFDPGQMKQQLGNGKSLAEIATARGIDPAKLREAMLAAARVALDQAVRDGVLTQADADIRYADITRWTDDLLRGPGKR